MHAPTGFAGTGTSITLRRDEDWERLTLAERRALIRATIERVTVAPGRGAERITIVNVA